MTPPRPKERQPARNEPKSPQRRNFTPKIEPTAQEETVPVTLELRVQQGRVAGDSRSTEEVAFQGIAVESGRPQRAERKAPHAPLGDEPSRSLRDKLRDRKIVLLLQGGGALGAYQMGAFKALYEACKKVDRDIDWVAGISIGAINASVIAGHRDPDPVAELERLWREFLSPPYPPYDWSEVIGGLPPWMRFTPLRALQPKYAAWLWTAFNPLGQLNFFSSRVLSPLHNPCFLEWWVPTLDRNELAFYGTEPLLETLRKHVNFPIGASSKTRLSVGTTRVSDGETVFFDSASTSLEPKHVMASGALPPAFPPIEVDGEWYFDGGVSSNTPIETLHEDLLKYGDKILVFVIDLWDRKAPAHENPKTWDELLWRQKCVQYGSRKTAVERLVRHHEDRVKLGSIAPVQLDICQIMREARPNESQFCFSDADFLHSTFSELSSQGEDDMNQALEATEVLCSLREYKFAKLYRYGTAGKHCETDQFVRA